MGSKNRTALRNRLEYFALLVARSTARSLGYRNLSRLGSVVGEVFHVLDRRRREVLDYNLRLAFPEMDERERNRMGHRVARHFGRVTLEALHLRGSTPKEILSHVRVEGERNLEDALSHERGVIFMSAHLGYWEAAALVAGLRLSGGLAVVNRPLDNPLLERELETFRELFGNVALGKRGVSRAMIKRLRENKAVGILIDQRSHHRLGLSVPFFGQPAWTHGILARMMVRTKAPMVPLWCFWEGPGRYTVRFDTPLLAERLTEEEREENALTRRLNRIIEDVILERPQQWLWYHDRWRSHRLGIHGIEDDQESLEATEDANEDGSDATQD